jgi:hypothetical protein
MPVDVWAIDTLTFSGLEARNAGAMDIMTDATALGSRSGVRPGDPGLTVTLAGTTINCSAGVAAVAYSGQGVYRVALPSSVSPGTYTAAHATLNRIDLVYLRVWDNSVDASGLAKATSSTWRALRPRRRWRRRRRARRSTCRSPPSRSCPCRTAPPLP